ncbi:aromatic ring-hydroxylating dioxygenase subunit alpha [Variovorax paradoxus]|uniref:aromatic ring-hydroxylating dioxygenase subunit alpha n=1 Tax=Variovorax paradoxus TaxID=34073 RepID=UPI00277EE2CD|nr:aromatic ring-hydroxylating dioxygenase subunit alpha [Variovorax paradoxus]MDP9932795.1 vanillate O-demethylase monooxygenase subunit [Variovorax paradoxus]
MSFLMDAWYMAAWHHEVVDVPFARRICGLPMVFFRSRDGTVAALEDRCCHRAAPLRFGTVVDQGLQCGYHGLVFDCTGRCVHVPGQERVPPKAMVRAYPLVEKDGILWVWPGDPARADSAKILDYPFHDDTKNWPHKTQHYHVKANYMLLVENLMDLTHLAYVHKSTIGGNPKAHVEAKMTVTPKDQGLHFIRWLPGSMPPPSYQKAAGLHGPIDRWMEFEYTAPGVVVQWTGGLPVGRNAMENRNQSGGFSLRILHCLTPETESTSFYFWSAANGYRQDDPTATTDLFKEIDTAFSEDKGIVEAQQEIMQETGTSDLVNIASDSARMQMRRALQRMLDAQSSAP